MEPGDVVVLWAPQSVLVPKSSAEMGSYNKCALFPF